jgi:hypothetical protein
MTAIRSERAPAARLAGNGAAQAKDAADVASFEGEIREFIRRDVAPMRRVSSEPATLGDPAADHVNKLVQSVSGASTEQIDRVILELQGIREMLRHEGERVSREIAGFASLNHAAITSMRVIADSLAQWKSGAQIHPGPR